MSRGQPLQQMLPRLVTQTSRGLFRSSEQGGLCVRVSMVLGSPWLLKDLTFLLPVHHLRLKGTHRQ